MNFSKEHKLALKISILLLIFAIIISYSISYLNHWDYLEIRGQWLWKNWGFNYNRYIIFWVLSVIIYFVSYFLAKFTIKPIEENNKKLKEYNHNLAHELKTPLAVIKSDLELLEMWKKLDLDIIKSSKDELISMQNIIDSLLFLSQKNNDELKLEKINLYKSIKNIIGEKFNNKLFKIYCENTNNCNIKVSEKLIEILVKNLFENAIKYWDNKEQINIEISKNKLIIQNKISKSVKKIDKERLFESFYQADNSRNTSWYWLWLSIVQKIISLHWFKINIDIRNNFFIVTIIF